MNTTGPTLTSSIDDSTTKTGRPRARIAAMWLLSALFVIATWGIQSLTPAQPGGDHDYVLLVSEALRQGIDHATGISTTYGPLAWLSVPSMTNPLEVVAGFALWFALSTVCAALLWFGLARRVHFVIAGIAVFAVLAVLAVTPMASPPTAGSALVMALSLVYATSAGSDRLTRAMPIFLAVFVAAMLLMKLAVGVVGGAALLGAILSRREDRIRSLISAVIAGVAGLIVFWIVSAQPPLGIISFLVQALSVGGGHADSMGLETGTNGFEYWALPVVVVLLGWVVAKLPVVGPRIWLWLGLALGIWLLFKQGFVRHDAHSVQFWATCTALFIVGAVLLRARWVVAPAIAVFVLQAVFLGPGWTQANPVVLGGNFVNGVRSVVDADYRADRLAGARAELEERLQVPQSIIDTVGDASMRSEPFDWAVWWTYGMDVAVLPSILNYGAYNEKLDTMNADWIADATPAPEYIVRYRTDVTLDWRQPLWDSPRMQLQQACSYVPVEGVGDEQWVLLERTDRTCGEPQRIGSADVDLGEAVPVPRASSPGSIVVAEVAPDRSLQNRLASFLFKPSDLYVTLGPGEPSRLPWTHSGAPLIVDLPEDLLPGASDRFAAEDPTLSMNRSGSITFYEVAIE